MDFEKQLQDHVDSLQRLNDIEEFQKKTMSQITLAVNLSDTCLDSFFCHKVKVVKVDDDEFALFAVQNKTDNTFHRDFWRVVFDVQLTEGENLASCRTWTLCRPWKPGETLDFRVRISPLYDGDQEVTCFLIFAVPSCYAEPDDAGGGGGRGEGAGQGDGAAGQGDGAAGEGDGAAGEGDGAAGESDGAAGEEEEAGASGEWTTLVTLPLFTVVLDALHALEPASAVSCAPPPPPPWPLPAPPVPPPVPAPPLELGVAVPQRMAAAAWLAQVLRDSSLPPPGDSLTASGRLWGSAVRLTASEPAGVTLISITCARLALQLRLQKAIRRRLPEGPPDDPVRVPSHVLPRIRGLIERVEAWSGDPSRLVELWSAAHQAVSLRLPHI